jgi:hypothetical protein
MAKRPALSEDTFLKHLFSPKKNPLPTGIRKRALKVGPASRGYKTGRVAAFNRMSAANQELLRRSGQEAAYLKGTGSLKDARATLRGTAVSKGIARPIRQKTQTQSFEGRSLDDRVAMHVIQTLRKEHYNVNQGRVYTRVPYMPEEDKVKAQKFSIGQIRAYAGDGTKVIIIEDQSFNPLWYR